MKTERLVLRVTPQEKAQFQSEAKKHEVSLSMWIVCHLIEACEGSEPLKPKPTIDQPKPVEPVISKYEPILTGQSNPATASSGKCIYCYSFETESMAINGGVYPVCLKHKNKAKPT